MACYVVNTSAEDDSGKKKCALPLEDYYECLHHKKEVCTTPRRQRSFMRLGNGPAAIFERGTVRGMVRLEADLMAVRESCGDAKGLWPVGDVERKCTDRTANKESRAVGSRGGLEEAAWSELGGEGSSLWPAYFVSIVKIPHVSDAKMEPRRNARFW